MNAQLLLLSYFLAVLVLAFAWPTFRVYKKTGINPYRLGNTDSAHNFVGKLFRFMLFGIFIAVILYAFRPNFIPILLLWPGSRTLYLKLWDGVYYSSHLSGF